MSDKFNGSFLLSQLIALKNSDEGVAVLLLRPHSLKVLWHLAEIINWPKFITDDIGDVELLRDIRNEIYTDNSMVYINLDGLLTDINTTLQERLQGIEDAIKQGGEGGDGSGNTIQDLIFWLKILFAISGGGALAPEGGALAPEGAALAPEETTTPLLSEVVDRLTGLGVVGGVSNVMLDEIRQELAGIKAKISTQAPAPLIIQGEAANNPSDLLVNGGWYQGVTSGLIFYAENWTYEGGNEDSETPQRVLSGGVWVMSFIAETQKSIKQNVRIPAGYGALNLHITNPPGVPFGQLIVTIYLSGEIVDEVELPPDDTEWSRPVYGNGGELIGIQIKSEMTSGNCGVVELLGYPVGISASQEVSVPAIGGSMGKGRKIVIQPDKKRWEVVESSGSKILINWVVDKIYAAADWVSLRLLPDTMEEQELQIAQEFKLDASVNVCHVNFTMSGGENPVARIEIFNDGVWEYLRDCTGSGDFSVTADLSQITGDEKKLRMFVSVFQPVDGLPFDLYNVELELID